MKKKQEEKKVKVTITARDRVGHTEAITLIIEESTAKNLERAANDTYPDGMPNNNLREELNRIEDDTKERMSMPVYSAGYLSPSQYRRLCKFDTLIFNKLHNYTLTINIKKK